MQTSGISDAVVRRLFSTNNPDVLTPPRFAGRMLCVATTSWLLFTACKNTVADGSGGSGQGGHGGQGDGPPVVTTLTPNAPPLPGQTECKVTITDNLPFEGHTHQPVCTPIVYKSNPPSSGDHWPIWAAFTTFEKAVPREMLVHDLEHGAVVMAYACNGPCPDVAAALEKAASDFGPDPLCVGAQGSAKRSRIVITPDPKLAAPIGLSAWRSSYVASCIDPPSLLSFIKDHYGHGTEQVCVEGRDPSDPDTGVPACTGI